MTDTNELLKYAEAMNIKASMIEMGERIAWGSDTEMLIKAGEIIKVLAEGLRYYATKFSGNDEPNIAEQTLTRATAILGGNLKDKTDE